MTFSGFGGFHFSAEGLMVKMERLEDGDQQTDGEEERSRGNVRNISSMTASFR